MQKKLIATIILKQGQSVKGLSDPSPFAGGFASAEDPKADAASLAADYSNRGADALLVLDQSKGDAEHDGSLTILREMARRIDIPMWGAGNVNRVEDVKKLLYAGCSAAVLNWDKPSNREMLKEVSERFGREKIAVCIAPGAEGAAGISGSLPDEELSEIQRWAERILLLGKVGVPQGKVMDFARGLQGALKDAGDNTEKKSGDNSDADGSGTRVSLILDGAVLEGEDRAAFLQLPGAEGYGDARIRETETDLMLVKAQLKEEGFDMNTFTSPVGWEDLKKGPDGLVLVVVQDHRNDEVLMAAYMNREAYEETLRTGRMTYWSRSRQELWIKGETSGHFQYLKELRIDCDNDTLLARIEQIGAACHTGNRSCFYRTLVKKDTPRKNPLRVFEDVFAVIEDRKQNPKEGSYTNYLFEKGIDKILKKLGEEATEIVIAAKNPEAEEVKYEMADFLYHMMVLMAERGLTWDDIAQELANRE